MERYKVKKYIGLTDELRSLCAVSAANGIMADKIHCIEVCLQLFEKVSMLSCMSNVGLDRHISDAGAISDMSVDALNEMFFKFKELLDDVHTKFLDLDAAG